MSGSARQIFTMIFSIYICMMMVMLTLGSPVTTDDCEEVICTDSSTNKEPHCTRTKDTQVVTLTVNGVKVTGSYCYYRCVAGTCPSENCDKTESGNKTATVRVMVDEVCYEQEVEYKDADDCNCNT